MKWDALEKKSTKYQQTILLPFSDSVLADIVSFIQFADQIRKPMVTLKLICKTIRGITNTALSTQIVELESIR